MAFLPIKRESWTCRAPGREDHYRVLYRHPVTELRMLRCPTCDNDEIVRWLASPGHIPDPLTSVMCTDHEVGPDGYWRLKKTAFPKYTFEFQKTIYPRPESALIIEDHAERQAWFYSQLLGVKVDMTYRVDEALALLQKNFYGLVVLDFDLPWRETGLANINTAPIAAYIARHRPELHVLIHSTNFGGVLALSQLLPDAVVMPFGTFEFEK
jgi:hypothetical protein